VREDVLRPPFQAVAFPPHLTLIHPRTSSRGREFWEQGRRRWRDLEFTVEEVAITAFDGTEWTVLEKFALGQGR
jgi:2'-5' RNA ligase